RRTRSVFLPSAPKNQIRTNVLLVDEGLLPLLELKFLAGRNFKATDVKDEASVVVVSKALADKLYPGGDALNRNLLYADEKRKIIAIVDDIDNPSRRANKYMLYSPVQLDRLKFIVKRKSNVVLERATLARAVNQFDSKVRIFSFYTLSELHDDILARDFATAAITIVLSVLTLFLASGGLYGVLSYGIKMRRYELGVRMAIGAKPIHIILQVLADNAKAIGLGLFLSLVIIVFVVTGEYRIGNEALELGVSSTLMAVTLTLLVSLLISILSLKGVANKSPISSLRLDD
ncbi:MAG: ABC transporter permease, partial [Psychrosphaera sp.]|nr:ABC transporter permease [Psychrosphaera sp.]